MEQVSRGDSAAGAEGTDADLVVAVTLKVTEGVYSKPSYSDRRACTLGRKPPTRHLTCQGPAIPDLSQGGSLGPILSISNQS